MAVEAVEPLARQALDLAKNALLVNLRFMNAAFARLHPFPVAGSTLATDGARLRYDPAALARLYAAEPAELTRAYLHIVLHNVFLHLYPGPHVDAARWDAACDIVAERTIAELDLPATRTARAARQQAALARIDAALPLATAETVYRYLQDEGLDASELAELRAPFYVDDHDPWYRLMAAEGEGDATEESRRAEEQEDGSSTAPASDRRERHRRRPGLGGCHLGPALKRSRDQIDQVELVFYGPDGQRVLFNSTLSEEAGHLITGSSDMTLEELALDGFEQALLTVDTNDYYEAKEVRLDLYEPIDPIRVQYADALWPQLAETLPDSPMMRHTRDWTDTRVKTMRYRYYSLCLIGFGDGELDALLRSLRAYGAGQAAR